MADQPVFIDPARLHALLGRPEFQVVAVDTENDYAAAHIPGALRISMQSLMASRAPVAGLLPAESRLAELFSDAGLRNDAHIVAYDRVGDGQAARLLYTLDAMGHDAFSLLDGGLAAWQAAGHELATGAPEPGASTFRVARQAEHIADRDWIEARLDDNDTALLDVRSAAEYEGHDVRSARGGHIPGAVNIDWLRLKDDHGRLRPAHELRTLLDEHGITPDRDITAYCQSHVRSSYAYLVLKALGYERVRGYPGAWSDWGNADHTPVATPADDHG